MDWKAKIYILRDGKVYRIKVFETIVTVECQKPPQQNELFSRDDFSVYSPAFDAWEWDEIDRLLEAYETAITEDTSA